MGCIVRVLIALSTIILVSIPTLCFSESNRRVALVIGNSAYKIGPLKNTGNDAVDMGAALEDLGFLVDVLTNANRRDMEDAIRKLGRTLRHGGIGLFYFAGHGLQSKGRNYLIPVGARLDSEADVAYEAVDAGRVLAQMDEAQNGFNIIILDACRKNPFARSFRSSLKGLARMDAPAGSYLAFATAPGSVADDGYGRNGLYTSMLLKHIKTPGLEIEKVFKRARIDVARKSGNKQIPWDSSSLMGDFYFNNARGIKVSKKDTYQTSYQNVSGVTPKMGIKYRTLRVGLDTFVPWAMKDKKGNLIGFEVDVARKLAADIGVEIEFFPTNWSKIIPSLLDKKFDVIIGGMAITESRKQKVDFTIPYEYFGATIVANRKLAYNLSRLEDYNQPEVTIAVRMGTTVVNVCKETFPNAKRKLFDNSSQMYSALINGKVHAIIASAPEPAFQAIKYPDLLFIPSRELLNLEPGGMALRKQDKDLLNVLNAWISKSETEKWLKSRHQYWFETRDWEGLL